MNRNVQNSSIPGMVFAACVIGLSATAPAQDAASGGQPAAKNSSGMVIAMPAAGGPLTPTRLEAADTVFNRFDTGRRGFLTKEQVQSLDGFAFDAADTDHDGKLTADEFSRGWSEYSAKK